MIYIRIKLFACILLMSLLSTTYAQPPLSLRQKLERLLQDSEYNDAINEIEKPQQIRGMLLKSLREHDLFDTSSEERFFNKLNIYEEASEASLAIAKATSSPLTETMTSSTSTTTTTTTTTTTPSPPKLRSSKTTLTSEEISSPVIGGIESLSTIIYKLIDMWKNSL